MNVPKPELFLYLKNRYNGKYLNNKIQIDQEEIRLGYFRFYGDNVRSWVMLWGEMFPCVSELCFKKHNIIVFIQGSSLLIYNTGYYDT